ncbi:MAG: helix-turn-helix domain-containing protein [Spirochaetales bacterium]|jgi:cytoskeletal protein RodZ|nr:helix-turn-helix domain-containing protein [Spirochaetales bacterium]
MESLGQKFKTAREARGFTTDQVARDTHIIKRYITSLEEEKFDQFPGDTYIMGFIRNYADYLGFNPDECVALYRNMKLLEQPIPMEALLARKSNKPLVFLIVGVLVLAGFAAGGYFLFIHGNPAHGKPPAGEAVVEKPAEAPVQYVMADEAVEQSFGVGDELIIKRQDISYTLKIGKIENEVLLITPVENMNLHEGEEAYLLLAPQGETLKVICRSIERGGQAKTVLFFDKYLQTVSGAGISASEEDPAHSAAIGSTNEPSRVKRSQVITESLTPAPFTIEAEFRGYCLFRYMTDSQPREERYFRRGETFRTDVRSEIRLWYSNSGSLRARISGNEIEFGKPGEVGSALIRWTRVETGGGYRLEVIPMY